MERGATSEQLMAEMAWVRRLARALVRDPALADDVAQDAWLVAAEKAPEEDRPLRPWLARVVMTLVRTRRRSELRRGVREQAATTEQAVPSAADLVERVELQRIVAGEVLALAEPYRTTILLHFVEGYASADIARRLGIPAGTVRRRLKTALDQLRARLLARPDRPAAGWLALLVPRAPATVGVLTVKKLAVIIAIVLLLLIALVGLSRHDRGTTSPPAATATAHPQAPASATPARTGAIPAWLAQAAAPDRRIAGQVLADGAPVAKATVRLALVVEGTAAQLVAEVTTDDAGAFDLGMQPAATFEVSASAAGRAPASLAIALADPTARPDRIVLLLGDCRSHMYGTVTDASGGPIAKARLSVAGLAGGETDVAGRYSVCLPPDAPRVRVDADGYGSVEERIGTMNGLQTMTGEQRRDFSLVPEAVLAGKVVDGTGRPVSGARVIARPTPVEARRHVAPGWTDSGADGEFRIGGLAPARFDVVAAAAGLATAAPVAAIARAASTSTEIVVVLGPAARVRGKVVQGGSPVAGATVVGSTAGQIESRRSVSQADGTFVLDGLPFGAVAFAADPYTVVSPALVTIDRAEIDRITLEVTAPTRIHGRVTRAGKPVPGAQVRTEDDRARTTADASGAYRLDGLHAGTVLVDAWDAREKAFALAKHFVLAAGDDLEADLELEGSGEIQGVVVDEGNRPVAGAYVQFYLANGGNDTCEGMSDADGKFECPMLLGGDYAGRVQPSQDTRKGFAPASDPLPIVHVNPREVVTGVRLAVRNERLAIRGSVVADGGPSADVLVEVLGSRRGSVDVPSAMAGADGAFEIRDLVPGTYAVHAHAADGGDAVVEGVVAGGAPVTIDLARPGAIEGTLAGFAVPPTITASSVAAEGLATVTGATFSITGLSPGRYTVQATAGALLDAATVEVASGKTAHVALTRRGTGRVEGAVLAYGTTTPIVGARCGVAMALGGTAFAVDTARSFTDATGHFALDAPIGHVRLVCIPPVPPWSGTGGELDVDARAVATRVLFSVKPTFGATMASVGIKLLPLTFPITIAASVNAAAAAGIQVGDHLVSIDGGSLDGLLPIGAWDLIANHAIGGAATLGVERGGVTREVALPVVDGGPP